MLFLGGMALFAAVPLIQVVINSFRTDGDSKTRPIGLPKEWVFNNYVETWQIGDYGPAFINSLIICFFVIIIVLLLVGLGAYALAKLPFKGRGFFIAYFFVAMSLPSFLYIIPDYYMMNSLGLINSRAGLIMIYVATETPFNMLLLRTFLLGIPRELEEAAKIDGCDELETFFRITLPIAKTIFMTVAMLVFVDVWNEFLWANTFLYKDALKTVAVRYVRFTGAYSSNMARIYTASVITMAPVIIMYLVFNRRFIEGLTSGSIKG